MPFKMQEIKNDDYTNFTLQCNQAFEEMAKSFSKHQDEIIINYLYEKYKDTKVSDVWVLSKPDFEKFLLEMLPKWKEPKQYVDELKLVEKSLKALEIIKDKRIDIESFYSSFIERDFNYDFYSSWYRGYGRNKLTEEEFNLLKEVLE